MKATCLLPCFLFALSTLRAATGDFFLGGMPVTSTAVANQHLTVITNIAYVVGYDETRKDPAWVAYKLVQRKPAYDFPRPDNGYPQDLNTIAKVPANAYSASPPDVLAGNARWDHGHMAANNAIMKVFGRDAQEATFKMSNMCPQSHRLNAGKWKALEDREYYYSQKYGELYTVCGPIFTTHIRTLTHGIEVPSAYYKILVRKAGNSYKALAVTFEYYPAANVTVNDYLQSHLTSIRDIETLTGLDFFNQLPTATQDSFEKNKAFVLW